MKPCTKCHEIKDIEKDFYRCAGRCRSECKRCTIAHNMAYQRRIKSWLTRFDDQMKRRAYMVEYYAKNKERFAAYRKKRKEKYPNYYRDYFKSR